ncbi:hypothetical protein J6590_043669 [Homalodisca vitripennis]|nr:hypothetical protein J6590_043669 [Homalodisca vitripennis]
MKSDAALNGRYYGTKLSLRIESTLPTIANALNFAPDEIMRTPLHLDYTGWQLRVNPIYLICSLGGSDVKVCKKFILNVFVIQFFGSLQVDVNSRFQESIATKFVHRIWKDWVLNIKRGRETLIGRERAASFDFRTPTTETIRRPRPTEARREESRIPQKHLERDKPSGKTDDSTSCRETAPGPSNGQQNKVANATSSPSTPGVIRKKLKRISMDILHAREALQKRNG